MGVSGFFGKNNLSGLDVSLDLPDELFAATHFPVKITLVNNRRLLPAFLIRVRINNKEVFFPFVPPKGADAKFADFYFPRRGSYNAGRLYLSSVYPFNFFNRYKTIQEEYEAIVFPQVKKCVIPGFFENLTARGGDRDINKSGYDGEMVSVRTYISGDPSRYIHWKSSAKTGELKTKEFSTSSHRPVIIDFEKVNIRDKEEKISCITYVILKAFRNNIPVGLKMRDAYHKPGLSKTHRISMLRELALYDKN